VTQVSNVKDWQQACLSPHSQTKFLCWAACWLQ